MLRDFGADRKRLSHDDRATSSEPSGEDTFESDVFVEARYVGSDIEEWIILVDLNESRRHFPAVGGPRNSRGAKNEGEGLALPCGIARFFTRGRRWWDRFGRLWDTPCPFRGLGAAREHRTSTPATNINHGPYTLRYFTRNLSSTAIASVSKGSQANDSTASKVIADSFAAVSTVATKVYSWPR